MTQTCCPRLCIIPLVLSVALIIGGCVKPGHNPEPPAPTTIPDEEVVRIPVVVHVLYNKEEYNISAEKINTQLAVLNADFRKANADQVKIPGEFAHLAADAGIEFILADKDPAGNATNGIVRVATPIDGWSGNNPSGNIPVEDLKLFHTEDGGSDAWPADRYLNIWVAEMSDPNGALGLAGYSSYPGADVQIDGVIIDPRAFGTTAPLSQGHTLGRTATHEIGHWLNLVHIFGEFDGCGATDFVDDTPNASTRYFGNPKYPQISCGHSNMFMNFMDYVDDEAMYLFTKGQRERMRKVFAAGGQRQELYQYVHGKNSKNGERPPRDYVVSGSNTGR